MNTLPKPHTCRTQKAQVARHDYLEVSRRVIGEPDIDYLQLYHRFIVNEWAAIKLDDSVALAALELGNPILDVFFTLHQGPFIQYGLCELIAEMTWIRQKCPTSQFGGCLNPLIYKDSI